MKLWLEESGFEVLLSEHNDFPQQPKSNSYDSCLQAIDRCDYFIQLIGHRIGGLYDAGDRISITRMEYRHAYRRAVTGQLKIIPLVRKELWDIREDRRALQDAIRQDTFLDKELSDTDKKRIFNCPSKFANEAETLFEFLREVGRVDEMKLATRGEAPLPSANWIYQFNSFRDVLDALKTTLDLRGNLRQKTLRTNLVHELELNTRALLTVGNGTAFPFANWCQPARKAFSGLVEGTTTYTINHAAMFACFIVNAPTVILRLRSLTLTTAIESGEFLRFDRLEGRHAISALQSAMLQLSDEITVLRRLQEAAPFQQMISHVTEVVRKASQRGLTAVAFENAQFIFAMRCCDGLVNVQAINKAMHRYLTDKDREYQEPQLLPNLPLFQSVMDNPPRDVSREDALKWL